MRKIHEIFALQKTLPDGVVHWTQVHGNILFNPPNHRFLIGYVVGMNAHLRGTAIKKYPEKKHHKVFFDRSFLIAKIFTVLRQLHAAYLTPQDIKSLIDEAYTVFLKEVENQQQNDTNDTGN